MLDIFNNFKCRMSFAFSFHLFFNSTCSYDIIFLLILTNHGPHPCGIAGTLTFGPCLKPNPAVQGLLVGKTTADFPSSLLSFHFTALFAYTKQIPGIFSILPWQNFGQSPAHFHGYPPPSPTGGGRGYKWLVH